ncbi:hypothetical protein ADL28_42100 [Streptomyces violaceusniger]|uniref:Uncharacterized protein n=1 Tax=Streptomyces violaceusniger TaxID=68280 RepID=A0A0X3VHJ6_STRVO|nr:hypothetical protein ADL28_42100 [Streptomyces violaceusniger]
MQQRRQERPIARREPCSITTELTLEHCDLMAEGQDLRILVPVAHRQQTQQRERVGHSQVGQSQQHGRSSCRVDCHLRETADSSDEADHRQPGCRPPTRTDDILGKRRVFGHFGNLLDEVAASAPTEAANPA